MATAEDKTRTAGAAASTDSSAKAAGAKTAKKVAKKTAKKTSKATKQTARSSRRNRPGPRQRLLASATNLFTTQGIRVIGIDRILRDADVAKASLYSLFGSKDNLVVAYLQELDQKWREDWHAPVSYTHLRAHET